jgi:hypothetical protein
MAIWLVPGSTVNVALAGGVVTATVEAVDADAVAVVDADVLWPDPEHPAISEATAKEPSSRVPTEPVWQQLDSWSAIAHRAILGRILGMHLGMETS